MSSNTGGKKESVIIANCSGFLGDRLSAAGEMVRGGKIDVLTGDYLAELTMAILLKKKLKDPGGGYVSTFLKQMEEVMGECLDKDIKVVANAGGLNPKGLADELQKLADKLGLKPKIAYIEGDNLLPVLTDLQNSGEKFIHMDKNISLKDANANPISANAYLGGWGIVKALHLGADIVIGGRIADAALVLGPAAWWFNWKEDEYNKLAGAVTAGHIIECGAQATGGNYSFMDEVPSFKNVGFPIAEIYNDGSFAITKHPGTGGLVSVGTVKAQLLYEVRRPGYIAPDVTARFDSINISHDGEDRVVIRDVYGEPPPDTAKVCINVMGGFRNSMTVVLTGLDIEKKAKIVEETLFESIGGKEQFEVADVNLIRSDKINPGSNEESFAYMRFTLMGPDSDKVGRFFSGKVVEMALASVPGFTLLSPPSRSVPAVKHWPALVSGSFVKQKVFIDDKEFLIEPLKSSPPIEKYIPENVKLPEIKNGNPVSVAFGKLFGTRSGDKGGNANLGVWAKTPESFSYLLKYLTIEKLNELLPDIKNYEIERYEFRNLYALNFYIIGILGDGVAASIRSDPQAKTFGEYLRAKIIEIPESINI